MRAHVCFIFEDIFAALKCPFDSRNYSLNCCLSEGCTRDVVILDVDSKDASLGMSCPPATFIDVEFLKSVDRILKPTGISFPCV